MYKFSQTSLDRLNTCHPRLQEIAHQVIKYTDFTVVTGHRTREEQNRLYPRYTRLQWPKGKHNQYPSIAIDVAPFIRPYGVIFGNDQQVHQISSMTGRSKTEVASFIEKAYARLVGTWEGVAFFKYNTTLRLGIDWSRNFDMLDQTFHDLGHIELIT